MSPYCIPEKAGTPYRPSNGTEGMMFMERFCERCACDDFDDGMVAGDIACTILTDTMIYDPGDPGYPPEWTHNERGEPMCTAFCPENACPIDARPKPPRQIDGQLTIEEVANV